MTSINIHIANDSISIYKEILQGVGKASTDANHWPHIGCFVYRNIIHIVNFRTQSVGYYQYTGGTGPHKFYNTLLTAEEIIIITITLV